MSNFNKNIFSIFPLAKQQCNGRYFWVPGMVIVHRFDCMCSIFVQVSKKLNCTHDFGISCYTSFKHSIFCSILKISSQMRHCLVITLRNNRWIFSSIVNEIRLHNYFESLSLNRFMEFLRVNTQYQYLFSKNMTMIKTDTSHVSLPISVTHREGLI